MIFSLHCVKKALAKKGLSLVLCVFETEPHKDSNFPVSVIYPNLLKAHFTNGI